MELSDLGEVKVKWEILILVLDCEIVISAFIYWAFTKCDGLATDLDIWIASSSHHLNLQIIKIFIGALERDQSHRGIFFRLDSIFFFTRTSEGATGWLCSF